MFKARKPLRPTPSGPRRFRPTLEALDDRITPATFKVTLTTDTGLTNSLVTPLGPGTPGDLRNAIFQADQTPGTQNVIDLTGVSGTITLSAMLPPIFTTGSGSLLIVGAGTLTISGNNLFRPFFIDQGTVGIANLTVANGLAQGGAGGAAAIGGGAGAGLGGGLLINSGTVTLTNVVFDSNRAQGGAGGAGSSGAYGGGGGAGGNGGNGFGNQAGGGGGFLGNGGDALYFNAGGGGGGFTGAGGNTNDQANGSPGSDIGGGGGGGSALIDISDPPTTGGAGASGGGNGGTGSSGGGGGGGGGSSGFPSSSSGQAGSDDTTGGVGGNGGFGGGGGGGALNQGGTGGDYGGGGGANGGGNGGFGGGGGAGFGQSGFLPGNGGFGGGGGGGQISGGSGGAFGGNGGSQNFSGGGGGGAGLGGAVFVRTGILNLIDATFTNNSATGGAGGGGGATAGQGVGGAVFVMAGATATALGSAPTYSGNTASDSSPNGSGALPTDAGATLTATAGTPQSAIPGQAFGAALQATLKTGANNPIPNAVLPFFAPPSGASATLSPLGGATNSSGQVSVGATANGTTGGYLVLAGGSAFHASFSLQNDIPQPPAAPPPAAPLPPAPLTRVATGSTSGGFVSVFDSGRPIVTNATPFAGYTGAIAVAVGDVNGDTVPDVAVIKADIGASAFKVYDGATGAVLLDIPVFPATFGSSIALGDLNGDGKAEVIVGTTLNFGTRGSVAAVGVYDGKSGALRAGFSPYPEAPTGVGVYVATGDLDGDGKDEIITAPAGVGPLVRIFNGSGGFLRQFPVVNSTIGIATSSIAAGDLDGHGKAEILIGGTVGVADFAVVFNGATGKQTALPLVSPNQAPRQAGVLGPQLTAADMNGDGIAELLVTFGPNFNVYDGPTLALLQSTTPGSATSRGLYLG